MKRPYNAPEPPYGYYPAASMPVATKNLTYCTIDDIRAFQERIRSSDQARKNDGNFKQQQQQLPTADSHEEELATDSGESFVRPVDESPPQPQPQHSKRCVSAANHNRSSVADRLHSDLNLNETLAACRRPKTAPARVPKVTKKVIAGASYDEDLRVHGWRMEVHGDPLELKRPHLPQLRMLNIPIPDSKVLPPPPSIRKSNSTAFFHQTVATVTLSFDIHPAFASERFARTRASLMRQGKWNFAPRDFAFIY